MKQKALLLLFACVVMCGCQKKYQYVEEVIERSVLTGIHESENEPEEIKALNDTMAYIAAYRKFCISQSVYNKMVDEGFGEYLDIPLGFKLYNPEGKDISNIYFFTKAEKEKEIASLLLDIKDERVSVNESTSPAPRVDSACIKDLLPFFRIKKDEFDPHGATWYEPKSAPQYTNRNGIYLYFKTTDGVPGPLRFRVQYFADDWLFFKKVQFSIDSSAYEYIPFSTETDNGGGDIWEWFDESLSSRDKELIYALSEAKSAKMKFIGRQYYGIRTISKQQIIDIKRSLDLYKAMGGSY